MSSLPTFGGKSFLSEAHAAIGPSTRAPALAGDSCSGFRPTGGLEGATGLPVGLHIRLAVVCAPLVWDEHQFGMDQRDQLPDKSEQF